jgi:hypothetical protein
VVVVVVVWFGECLSECDSRFCDDELMMMTFGFIVILLLEKQIKIKDTNLLKK